MHMAGRTITSIALVPEEIPAPIFIGRENGTVEKYSSADAACFGKPVITLYGHSKAVTSIVALSPEEIHTSSMDGTVRQWSTETEQDELNRCLSVFRFFTPLRCLAMKEGRFYTGGNDGCLSIIDGPRRATWSGHKDALTCIAFGHDESSIVITGGYDNHIRVWDSSTGKTIRLFVGHRNHIKCLRVVSGDVLLSFSRDLTLKVWRLPDIGDEPEEDSPMSPQDPNRHATVSFKEPGKKSDDDAEDNAASEEGVGLGTQGVLEDKSTEGVSVAEIYRAAVELGKDVKSALKSKPEQPIRHQSSLGTIEIPGTPQMVTATNEDAAYCYVGASDGYVFGINARALSRTVLHFVAHNNASVRADIRDTRLILRDATRAIRRRCRRAVQQKQRDLLRVAKKAKKAKRAEERKEKAAVAAALRAERAAARAAAKEQDDDDEEGEEDDEEGDSDLHEEDEEEENEDEEGEEEEDEDPLAPLDEAQREEFTAFRQAEEKVRDEEIAALRRTTEERRRTLDTVASATYDTARDQFFRLSFTSYKRVGKEAVLALSVNGGTCCAAQADRLVPVDITPGITYL